MRLHQQLRGKKAVKLVKSKNWPAVIELTKLSFQAIIYSSQDKARQVFLPL